MAEAYWKEFKRRNSGETKSSFQTMTTKNIHKLWLVMEHLNNLQVPRWEYLKKSNIGNKAQQNCVAVFDLGSPGGVEDLILRWGKGQGRELNKVVGVAVIFGCKLAKYWFQNQIFSLCSAS